MLAMQWLRSVAARAVSFVDMYCCVVSCCSYYICMWSYCCGLSCFCNVPLFHVDVVVQWEFAYLCILCCMIDDLGVPRSFDLCGYVYIDVPCTICCVIHCFDVGPCIALNLCYSMLH